MTQQYQFFNRDLLEEACNLRGDGYKMIDGILHKQSYNRRMPNLRGYPGAKMARKAAQGKIGKRA